MDACGYAHFGGASEEGGSVVVGNSKAFWSVSCEWSEDQIIIYLVLPCLGRRRAASWKRSEI